MILFPAIDLYNGNCVRLEKGAFDSVKIYNESPLLVAQQYEFEGARWIHIIDLNGAETGNNMNLDVIKDISEKTNLKIQVGGGIRSLEKIEKLLNLGVTRVILGSFAVNNMEQLKELIKVYDEKIIVSVDSKDGYVRVNGWQNKTALKTIPFCKTLQEIGVKTIVYTDISKDGMMSGPNFKDYIDLSKDTTLKLIASGGVSSYSDVKELNTMKIYGAIVGKALYINEVTVKGMIQCLQEE